ncbi:unnamed protein product, partial [marine sediment metagenome]
MDTALNNLGVTTGEAILEFSYLLAAVFFVIGLKLLSHPQTARRGNMWAAGGMLLAMITTLVFHKNAAGEGIQLANLVIILLAIATGTIFGSVIARKVQMTAMPQLVSIFNATGGAASALVALIEFSNPANESTLVTLLGLVIGSIAFSGSMIAYGKLDGKVGDIFAGFMKYLNLFILLVVVVMIVYITAGNVPAGSQQALVYLLLAIALVYGVTFVLPIGGADMPVVIS